MRMPPPVALTGDPDERNYKSPKFVLGSLTTITIFSDYICPWCWVGWRHARRLTKKYGVTFDWRGAELVPPSMEFKSAPPKPVDPSAPPPTPSRFDLFLRSERIPLRSPRPPFVRSHAALLGAEFAQNEGPEAFDAYNEGVFRAYWERHEDISDRAVLSALAEQAGLSGDGLVESVRAERYAENVVPFDEEAYTIGVRHVPMFLFGGEELLSEANYTDLAHATERFLYRLDRLRKAGKV
jgi:predicted DsbA family dithiol-disulfide isomerase